MIDVRLHNISFDDTAVIPNADDAIRITVSGHSLSGIKGNDIICSAVSAIVQTAVVAISRIARMPQRLDQKDGFLSTEVHVSGNSERDVACLVTIISTMIVGLDEIAKIHPDALKISFD